MTAVVIAEGLAHLLNVAERAATQALLVRIAKPAFDQIEQGTGGGSKARVATQPTLHTGMLVRAVVVDDQVQVQFPRRLLIDAFEEAGEFLMPVLRPAVPDDSAIERTQRREQSRGAVARVVVSHGAAA